MKKLLKSAIALALSCCIGATNAQTVQQNNSSFIGEKKIYYGASYYPEAWPEAQVDQDIKRMKELRMNVMRMAEFSWSTMEPEEGKYNFSWLHKVIEKLHAAGIATILGTPTATPPAWLVEKYPQMMQVDEMGIPAKHGIRRDCNYASDDYRRESQRICERMAQEFGNKPGVIAWQTDNEFSVHFDYGKESERKWHLWLKDQYKTTDNLNKLWGLALWSQHYNKWEQIPMPDVKKWYHPSLKMAWHRFWNEQLVSYQDIHIKAIRKFSKLPITHDGMPSQKVDYPELFRNLDFMAVNNYHSFEAYDLIMSNYDRMRGFNKGMHWLFETAPNFSGGGNNGQTWFLHMPDGSMRAAMWMNHALGAQGTMFWLWRQHKTGQEMTHGSVLHNWGQPAANYDDLKNFGLEMEKLSKPLMDMPVAPAQIAVMWDHKALIGLGIEENANNIKYYQDWTYRFYLPLAMRYYARDVISPGMDISRYKMLFAPLLPILDNKFRAQLKAWVEAGGTLVLGPMSAYRDEEWAGFPDYCYGDLEPWMGITTKARIPLGTSYRPAEIPLKVNYKGKEHTAALWAEDYETKNGKVLATYQNIMQKGKNAIVENKVGKGTVVVLGTDPGKEVLADLLADKAKAAGIEPMANGDAGVVVAHRKGKTAEATILVNISNAEKSINLKKGGKDLITNTQAQTQHVLKPYEVKFIQH